MLYKCANPACASPFRYLSQGKLFQIETESQDAAFPGEKKTPHKRGGLRRVARYWLCDRCSSWLTLAVESQGELVTVPLPGQSKSAVFGVVSKANATGEIPGVMRGSRAEG
jgi:hypothetical protein